MAHASGILSSVAHAVEGVPLSSIPQRSAPTGALFAPETGAPPIEVVSSAPAGVSKRGKVSARGLSRDDRFGALASRFVVRFTCRGITTYLHSYDDTGVWPTFRLDQAKLFASRTVIEAIATLLRGEV